MIRSAPPVAPHRRKAGASLDDFLESKKAAGMFALKQEFSRLLLRKREFIARQRRGSLLVDTPSVADDHPLNEFASFYRKVSNAPMSKEEHPAQLKLIEQVIQESMVVEWPRTVPMDGGEHAELDMAPLIHRARNVVKCRTSHPTLRIKVFAVSSDSDSNQLRAPPTMEAFFRATLVKLSNEGGEPRQVAGKMILTQREGTAASKAPDQSGACVTADGKLVASQAAVEAHSYVILDQMNESSARTTPFRYENGVLCATFPEMGVTLNSMVDRRQLATRYAIQVEVALNVDNKLIVNHLLLSHAFLIAITNDQTEPLLQSIFWSRLADPIEQPDSIEPPIETPLRWGTLRSALKNFIKAQLVQARQLHHHELCHLQCMIFLPRLIRCQNVEQLAELETELFGNSLAGTRELRDAMKDFRDRLLAEEVQGDVTVERHEFMQDKCLSLLDMTTELSHSPWLWLFRVAEMIQDVGHRLCHSPQMIDKKSSKTKKQMAASEEYQTMCSLFNKGLLTVTSVYTSRQAFHNVAHDSRGGLLVRFCDENSGYFSLCFGTDESGQMTMGSLSAEQVKDFKQGLAEVLIDESFPAKFERIIRIEPKEESNSEITVTLHRKEMVFHSYTTTRTRNENVQVMDSETQRVNPLSGERLERAPLAAFAGLGVPQLGQESATVSWPAHLLVLFQQHLSQMKVPEGFNVGTLLAQNSTDGEDVSDEAEND